MKKKIFLFIFCLLSVATSSFSQFYIDMTQELSNIKGNLTIDANILQKQHNTKEQIVIRGEDMVLNNRSSFLFNNVIVQLVGKIKVKGKTVPRLVNSHIICKRSDVLKSKYIHIVENQRMPYIGEVEYIKKLKGNPKISVYKITGKCVFKGTKIESKFFKLPIGTYDVQVQKVGFKGNVLFIN